MSDETEEPTADDLVASALDLETQKRLWIRTLTPVIQGCSADAHPNTRVQFALDMMRIAAAEKVRDLCAIPLRKE